MEKKPENPFIYPQEEAELVGSRHGEARYRAVTHHGMTLRDWFAGEIAAQLAGNPAVSASAEEIAKESYDQSDALLVEREKEKEDE